MLWAHKKKTLNKSKNNKTEKRIASWTKQTVNRRRERNRKGIKRVQWGPSFRVVARAHTHTHACPPVQARQDGRVRYVLELLVMGGVLRLVGGVRVAAGAGHRRRLGGTLLQILFARHLHHVVQCAAVRLGRCRCRRVYHRVSLPAMRTHIHVRTLAFDTVAVVLFFFVFGLFCEEIFSRRTTGLVSAPSG